MRRSVTLAAASALLLGAAAASAPIAASTATAEQRACFRTNDWHNSSAGGPRDIYALIGMHDVWHFSLAQDCPGARFPGPVSIDDLVTGIDNQICSGVDMQIRVKPQGSGVATACIVKSIDKLTPDEIKALPRRARP